MPIDRPRGAAAIITNSRGEYLLHLRDDIPGIAWPGHWGVLAGGCEEGETPRETIVRELQEEAGLVVDERTELCAAVDRNGSGELLTYFTGVWDGDARALPLTEGQKLDWVAPEQLGSLLMPDVLREVLNRHRATPG